MNFKAEDSLKAHLEPWVDVTLKKNDRQTISFSQSSIRLFPKDRDASEFSSLTGVKISLGIL